MQYEWLVAQLLEIYNFCPWVTPLSQITGNLTITPFSTESKASTTSEEQIETEVVFMEFV